MEDSNSLDEEYVLPAVRAGRRISSDVRSFLRTRTAVIAGEILVDSSVAVLRSRGLLRPFTFKRLQVLFSGGVGIAVLTATAAILGVPEPSYYGSPPFVTRISPEVAILADRIHKWAVPLIPTTVSYFVARLMAWASLKKSDRTPYRQRRARDHYLYLAAAFGLIPETLLGLSPALMLVLAKAATQPERSIWLPCLSTLTMAGLLVWQLRVSFGIVPRRLFILNGYSDVNKLSVRRGGRYGPWGRYAAALVIGGLLIAFSLNSIADLLALAIASAAVEIRELIVLLQRRPSPSATAAPAAWYYAKPEA